MSYDAPDSSSSTESTLYVMDFPHGTTTRGDLRTGMLCDVGRDLTLSQKFLEWNRLTPVVGVRNRRFLTGEPLRRR